MGIETIILLSRTSKTATKLTVLQTRQILVETKIVKHWLIKKLGIRLTKLIP